MTQTEPIKYVGKRSLKKLFKLIKADLANKQKTVQYEVMPRPGAHINETVQYTGQSDLNYKRGCFYMSDGVAWKLLDTSQAIVVCQALPVWDFAKPETLYFVKPEGKAYIRNDARLNGWHLVGGGEGSSGVLDFNLLQNTPTINGIETAGVPGQANDVKLTADVEGQSVPVNQLEFDVISAEDIQQMFEEA